MQKLWINKLSNQAISISEPLRHSFLVAKSLELISFVVFFSLWVNRFDVDLLHANWRNSVNVEDFLAWAIAFNCAKK